MVKTRRRGGTKSNQESTFDSVIELKYDQTTARQDMWGIATRESPGHGNRQDTGIARKRESRIARTEESPGKTRSAGETRRKNAHTLG